MYKFVRPTSFLSIAALLIAGVFATAGCDSGVRQIKRRAAESAVNHDDYARLGYRLEWRGFPYVERGQSIQFMRLTPDGIAVLESGSTLSLLELDTGRSRWQNTLATPLTRFVGIEYSGSTIIAASDAELFIIDINTGELIGRHQFEKVANTPPLAVGGLALYGTTNGEIVGHMLQRGLRLWGNAAEGAIVHRPVRVGNGAVGVVTQTGVVMFVDEVTGTLLGRGRIYGGVESTPASGEGLMFVASLDQSLYAFAPGGSIEHWRYQTSTPLTDAPTYHASRVYCNIPGQGMTAFDAQSSAPLWSSRSVGGEIVALRNGRLVAWDGRSGWAVDPADGTVIEQIPMRGVQDVAATTFQDGDIYVLSESGVVSKFVPRN